MAHRMEAGAGMEVMARMVEMEVRPEWVEEAPMEAMAVTGGLLTTHPVGKAATAATAGLEVRVGMAAKTGFRG